MVLQKLRNLFKKKENPVSIEKPKTPEEILLERFNRGEILQVNNHIDNIKYLAEKKTNG